MFLLRRWRAWALGLAVGIAVAVPSARAASRYFLFPGHRVRSLAAQPDFLVSALVASDGAPVHVLELPAAVGAWTIVHFHNNRETVEACDDLAHALHARGFGVLLIEYRGYGASRDLDSTEEGLYRDAEAGLDMLAARGIGPARVALSGISLGTGVAAEMARRGRGARLVLMTPYTSIPDLVTGMTRASPAGLLLPDHFDTLSKTGGLRIPTLVVHGDADEIVPFWMGERVARSIAGARLVRVGGGHHGDLFARDAEGILAEIAAFLET
jgi:hypothetical protein